MSVPPGSGRLGDLEWDSRRGLSAAGVDRAFVGFGGD